MPQELKSPGGLELQAKLFRGLSDVARLAILNRLRKSPLSSGQLAKDCGLSPSNASNHLRCLLECGLVALEPQGRRKVYRLSHPQIGSLLDASSGLLVSPRGNLIQACQRYGLGSRLNLVSAAIRRGVRSGRRGVAIRSSPPRKKARG